jgi:hypothetical protein
MTTQADLQPISKRGIARSTLLAAVATAAATGVLFLLGSAFGLFPATIVIPASGQPVSLGPVLFMSVIAAIGGGIVYAILSRLTKQPKRIFRILAVIVLVLSFGAPSVFPNAPTSYYIALNVLHIVAAAMIPWVLTSQRTT